MTHIYCENIRIAQHGESQLNSYIHEISIYIMYVYCCILTCYDNDQCYVLLRKNSCRDTLPW